MTRVKIDAPCVACGAPHGHLTPIGPRVEMRCDRCHATTGAKDCSFFAIEAWRNGLLNPPDPNPPRPRARVIR